MQTMNPDNTHTIDPKGFLWVEQGEQREGVVAEVAPLLPIHRTYSFAVPLDLEDTISVGQRVNIPIGRRQRTARGYVVSLDRKVWDSTLRTLQKPVETQSYISSELVSLGREISEHYACPLGQTLKAMVPQAVHRAAGLRSVRYVRLIRPLGCETQPPPRLGPKQRAAVDVLAEANDWMPATEVQAKSGASVATLRSLAKSGWVEIQTRKVLDCGGEDAQEIVDPGFTLNDEQQSSVEAIQQMVDAKKFAVALLFGVSGSGKTEVYIRAMQTVLASRRQVMLLVPEIVLTTQLVNRLARRFQRVAVLHSGLTDAQRSVIWRHIQTGKKTVVIGTRSAVFAPCPDLGLIVVDEEQETSYKNLQAPRFHVRDVAIMRARQRGIPVVLGSATPSIEAWHRSATRDDYRRLHLTRRVTDQPMPKVHVVDMRDEIAERKQFVMLSRSLERLLGETLDRSEQAILLMNRRGFARRVYCPECKTSIQCPNCNVAMVTHTAGGMSICHYCRKRTPTPKTCPNVTCGAELVQHGAGTQRIEQVLNMLFPDARIQRVDSDTMTHRDRYQQVVDSFEAREIDILIGTQMIAKGLDFPYVSFVGVFDADPAALAGDFRANEQLFQLLTQVAGRAGRAHTTGKVVVQTSTPELPALQYAAQHDYEGFAEAELKLRAKAGLPPFRRVARVILSHAREQCARDEATIVVERIREAITKESIAGTDVLGPTPCALKRIRGRYRFDLLVCTPTAMELRRLLKHMQANAGFRTKAESIVIDVDPVSFS